MLLSSQKKTASSNPLRQSQRITKMKKHYPFFQNITPDDCLLNLANHHLNQVLSRYSKVLAFRMDFSYQKGSNRYIRNSTLEIQDDLRELMNAMIAKPAICGCFWVLEWTRGGAVHAHAIFYIKGQKHKKSFPFMLEAESAWGDITRSEGKIRWCHAESYHKDNINTIVDHKNDADVESLRRIVSYLTKEDQKHGNPIWGCNEVPPPARQGRPRK